MYLSGRLQTIQAWHGNVRQDNIRCETAGEFRGFPSIAGFGDDLNVLKIVQQRADSGADELMVVHEQDANGAQFVSSLSLPLCFLR